MLRQCYDNMFHSHHIDLFRMETIQSDLIADTVASQMPLDYVSDVYSSVHDPLSFENSYNPTSSNNSMSNLSVIAG